MRKDRLALLTNLVLLQRGYAFVKVVSHERLVEANKAHYYLALNQAQRTWKGKSEDVTAWLVFFLETLRAQAGEALGLLEGDHVETLLSPKQLALWRWAREAPEREFGRKEAVAALDFPARTVESIIKKLLTLKQFARIGEGRATRYRVEPGKAGHGP